MKPSFASASLFALRDVGFGGLGFRALGFRVLGVEGFRGLAIRAYRV